MTYDPPSTIDPDGRRVVFDTGSHLYLAAKRPWLLDEIDTILDTIAHPDLHVPRP
jgi:glyoxylase-like metal-dependent hydrolase (beta-lactamase superfamily II)